MLAFACAFTMFAGAAFTDQADIETADAVDTLVALGVIDGYEDGSFQPDVTVNRAEMAKMIYTILNGGNDDASAYENLPTSFTDLGQEGWATGYIKYLQNTGIIAGKTVTQFAPSDTVTGVEAAKMMLVAAGYSADKAGLEGSAWIANTMRYANMNNLFDGVSCDVNSGLPRQYAAQIMYNSLDMENVVYSNDIEGFKPATDVSEDKTIGGKYMDLVSYEGVLDGAGEYGTAPGSDKIYMAEVDKINKTETTSDNHGSRTWTYAEDVASLVGQYVKVQTGKNNTVYGVFAVANENTVVTDTFAKVEITQVPTAPTQGNAGADGKVKIDGTEYKLAADFTINGVSISNLANIDKVRSGDQISFVSNDGDSKFDAAYVNPMTNFGEVLYVGADSITVAGESDSFDKADIIYPEDLAEGDYVAVYADPYTGNDMLVKADKISGEIEGTKDNDIRIDGTWYTLGETTDQLWTNMVRANIEDTPSAEDEYTLQIINGVVYNAELETAGSTDTALVIATPGSFSLNGNYQVKLLFSDNSQTVVEADKSYNGWTGKLVTYETDSEDVYELTEVGDSNLAGGDSYASSATASFDESATRVVIGGTNYRVSSSATVYVQYYDDDKVQYRAMTGSNLNNIGDDFTAEAGGAIVIKDGLASVVMLKSSTNYLPGAGSDKVYGYVTDVIMHAKDYTELNVWTSDNTLLENVRVRGTAPDKGDLISFNLSSDNYLEGVKIGNAMASGYTKNTVQNGAIQDAEMGEFVNFYKDNSSSVDSYDLTDDTKFIYLDTNNTKGIAASSLSVAQKDSNGDYFYNAKYIVNNDGEIVMIACDVTSRKWLDTNGDDIGTVTAKDQEVTSIDLNLTSYSDSDVDTIKAAVEAKEGTEWKVTSVNIADDGNATIVITAKDGYCFTEDTDVTKLGFDDGKDVTFVNAKTIQVTGHYDLA